jgi:poly(3-hydroxybutyrate) depolymerase
MMYKRAAFCLAVLIGLTANAQSINLRGVVSNQAAKPIANAIVTLAGQGLKDTTGTDGAYSIVNATPAVVPLLAPQNEKISLYRGDLTFCVPNPSPVKVEIFDVNGNLLKKEPLQNVSTGFYRFNIAENSHAARLLIIKASIGQHTESFTYLPLNNGNYMVNQLNESSTPVEGRLAKIAAVNDTLKTTAPGFATKATAITSYDQVVNITLDSNRVGSDTGRSVGCGKALSAIKSGTYTITSAGLSRQYIIDIPTTYDKNKPYRLIFGMHCYGSNMQGVANDKYYQLKRFADSTKNYCIFVAPNGTGSTPLWNQGAADHTFFDDMLKLFKDSLCVDTTRVFSCGFSYGAMFSYSLSTNHQKQLRAVACYAPANWNIWLPTNTHEPIAYFQTTGTSDGNCPWIYDSTQQLGGKYCVLGHIKDNGCTVPSTIPLATSTHVSTEFSGCKDGYPVKFGSFPGGHQAGPMDGASGDNSSKSWIPGETWKFFMQF